MREHSEVNLRVFVAREADEAHLALALRLLERLDRAAGREVQVGVVVVDDFVNLPEVEVVGLQSPQRLFELAQRRPSVAPVRADLRHQENFFAPPTERLAHQLLAVAFVVLPRVVHEGEARVNRLVRDADGLALRLRHAEVVAAERERRDLDAGSPQPPARDFA